MHCKISWPARRCPPEFRTTQYSTPFSSSICSCFIFLLIRHVFDLSLLRRTSTSIQDTRRQFLAVAPRGPNAWVITLENKLSLGPKRCYLPIHAHGEQTDRQSKEWRR